MTWDDDYLASKDDDELRTMRDWALDADELEALNDELEARAISTEPEADDEPEAEAVRGWEELSEAQRGAVYEALRRAGTFAPIGDVSAEDWAEALTSATLRLELFES